MYVILAYDIRVKRVNKVHKIVKQYLRPVQKSVFEGFLSEGEVKQLKAELLTRIDPEEDSIRIYLFQNYQGASVEEIGQMPCTDFTIL